MDKKKLLIDFDGTISMYLHPWEHAGVISDVPVPGIREALLKLKENYYIQIWSSRINEPEGKEAIKAYMEQYDLYYDEISLNKERAYLVIDDRALQFKGDWSDKFLEQIDNFEVWNKNFKIPKIDGEEYLKAVTDYQPTNFPSIH